MVASIMSNIVNLVFKTNVLERVHILGAGVEARMGDARVIGSLYDKVFL